MKPYSVLMLYPDFLAENYGEDTYLAWVDAEDVKQAARKAQVQAMRAQGGHAGLTADCFKPIFICEGHQEDLIWSIS